MNEKDFTADSPGRLIPIPNGGHAFLPDPLPPAIEIPADVARLAEKALLSIGNFGGLIHNLPNPQLLAHSFVRREAVLSSQIEGTKTELGQLLLFEIGETDNPSLLDKDDAQEVMNYVTAHNYAVERLSELPIMGRLLREVHARLLSDVRGQTTQLGEYRTLQNFIGQSHNIADARFVPPPPSEVPSAMARLEEYINTPSEIPTLIRFAMIHYTFEAIHPFADGNGRLGRLLLALLLRAEELLEEPVLYLSAYFVRHRREYYDHLLAVSQRGAWMEWFRFFLTGVAEASTDAVRRSKRLLDLRESYREQFQRKNAGALLAMIDSLFSFPAITNRTACDHANITYNAAQKHINTLVDADKLVEVTGRTRNRVYLAKEIVDVLQLDVPP